MALRLNLSYWIFGTAHDQIFEVKIVCRNSLTDLRERISDEHPHFFLGIPRDELRLWKVSGFCC
jgi:hypothetical protein